MSAFLSQYTEITPVIDAYFFLCVLLTLPHVHELITKLVIILRIPLYRRMATIDNISDYISIDATRTPYWDIKFRQLN